MRRTSLLYRLGVGLSRPLIPVAGLLDPAIRQGHAARREAGSRLAEWAATDRDPARPLVWFHAPSVGEGLQAEAVLRRVRQHHPDWQVVYTHFSPSAEAFARRIGADAADYLPYDSRGAVQRLLRAVRPTILVFTKLDLWPELATSAAALGTRVAMIAGTVRPNSSRLRWPARQLTAPGYRALSVAGAVSPDDATRLEELGVPASRIRVLGDPRFDSVADRVAAVPADDPLLRLGGGAPTLVAGSTWPGDEEVLLDAFARLSVHRPDARLVLAPHQPTPKHLDQVVELARRFGLPQPTRLSETTEPQRLLLVDRVGVLATLYGAGTMAYVGGGFHGAGLHSVLEPAAWGIPVVFGPRWEESRDAHLLLTAGGAEALAELGTAESGESLQLLWEDWIVNRVRREAQGRKAQGVVRQGQGAAERCAAMIEELAAGTAATV